MAQEGCFETTSPGAVAMVGSPAGGGGEEG